jgi:hypothetical protein
VLARVGNPAWRRAELCEQPIAKGSWFATNYGEKMKLYLIAEADSLVAEV